MSGAGTAGCYHCGLPLPRGARFAATIDAEERPMCCPGCQAAARLIVDHGMVEYYRRREGKAPRVDEARLAALAELRIYDDPTLQRDFVVATPGCRTATLAIEGITCAACAWLIERQLRDQPGVLGAQTNLAQRRVRVGWDPEQARLSELIQAIERLGYGARPYEPSLQEAQEQREQRLSLRRLGVAGLGMAQLMMFAVGLYAGAIDGIGDAYRDLLRWVSLLVASVVLVYAAAPFFRGALRDLRAMRPGMDLPVALALGIAYVASAWATVQGSGEVYFDSICMFTFFLTLARHLELRIRRQSGAHLRSLAGRVPQLARRVTAAGHELIPPRALEPGDEVLVMPGETIPADASVLEGESSLSEALLTGESSPRAARAGDEVLGGSQNIDGQLVLRVRRVGAESTLASILALLDRAASEKPGLARAADRVASWFVALVLLAAAGVGWFWWQRSPDDALWITLSVLVATCPCALSLATPAALAAASNGLAGLGFLITRGHVLETLARVDHMVFDKTGTLTSDTPRLEHVRPLRPVSATTLIAIARVLEQHSRHPFARALRNRGPGDQTELESLTAELAASASELALTPGQGVAGRVGSRHYRLGRPAWVMRPSPTAAPDPSEPVELHEPVEKGSWILLADEEGPLAWLGLQSPLRDDARDTLEQLRRAGVSLSLSSGDPSSAEVARVARSLGLDDAHAGVSPEQKLAALEALQDAGAVVAAVGDGINDAPLLGHAHVSIALAGGASIAHVSADAVLLGEHLGPLASALHWARRTRRVIRQNLAWALAYNLSVLPLAAAGFVPPWAAAIGMSLSSLFVVGNALRLAEIGPAPEAT